MEQRFFDKKNVILLKIEEDDLDSFLIDMDINDDGTPKYMLDEFANAIINVIPEYVFASYENPEIPQTDVVEKLREAAKCIYKIKEYEEMRKWYLEHDKDFEEQINKTGDSSRGEFGELLLHLLLRDFKHTIPLVSKVYFKDSASVPAHGFDCVHISPETETLWLGESKFYSDGKQGIKELLKDLNEHFNTDFLNTQFLIIKKNLEENSIPQRDEWIKILSECNKLKDKIKIINIPMLCIYPNDIYEKFDDLDMEEASIYHENDIRKLKNYFDEHNNHPLSNELNVILLLFPIRDKKELVKKLHEKLWHMQNM